MRDVQTSILLHRRNSLLIENDVAFSQHFNNMDNHHFILQSALQNLTKCCHTVGELTAILCDLIVREELRLNNPFETVDHSFQFDKNNIVQKSHVRLGIDDCEV
jgi:hypothetical protein